MVTMSELTAIIGGTALAHLPGMEIESRRAVRTPFGEPSCTLMFGRIAGARIVFLARHGYGNTIAPQDVNYRANLWALNDCGAERVFAVSSVAGLTPELMPGALVVPDQLIDYTYGRNGNFQVSGAFSEIDFTWPLDAAMREALVRACAVHGVTAHDGGIYACTMGKRQASAAEVQRYIRDGAHLLGSTLMPEAWLARELDMRYASLAVVVQRGAGLNGDAPTSGESMRAARQAALPIVQAVLAEAIKLTEGW
jgi:5'-methylthioadenosine phosphorylase